MSFIELDEASDTTASAAHTGVVQILLAVCWGVFIAVWIVAALVDRRTAPSVERRSGWWWGTSVVAAAGYLLVLAGAAQSVGPADRACGVWGSRTRAGSLTSGKRRVDMIPTCRCGSCT
jgi:hypothetical protein